MRPCLKRSRHRCSSSELLQQVWRWRLAWLKRSSTRDTERFGGCAGLVGTCNAHAGSMETVLPEVKPGDGSDPLQTAMGTGALELVAGPAASRADHWGHNVTWVLMFMFCCAVCHPPCCRCAFVVPTSLMVVSRYVKATAGHEFMVGQVLPWGQGVSWPVAEKGTQVLMPQVAGREGVHFFRGAADSAGKPRWGGVAMRPGGGADANVGRGGQASEQWQCERMLIVGDCRFVLSMLCCATSTWTWKTLLHCGLQNLPDTFVWALTQASCTCTPTKRPSPNCVPCACAYDGHAVAVGPAPTWPSP